MVLSAQGAEPALIGHHLVGAGKPLDALDPLEAAGRQALAAGAYADAGEELEMAIELGADAVADDRLANGTGCLRLRLAFRETWHGPAEAELASELVWMSVPSSRAERRSDCLGRR